MFATLIVLCVVSGIISVGVLFEFFGSGINRLAAIMLLVTVVTFSVTLGMLVEGSWPGYVQSFMVVEKVVDTP